MLKEVPDQSGVIEGGHRVVNESGTHRGAQEAQTEYFATHPEEAAWSFVGPPSGRSHYEPVVNSDSLSPSPLVQTIFAELVEKSTANGTPPSFRDQEILLGMARERAGRVHAVYDHTDREQWHTTIYGSPQSALLQQQHILRQLYGEEQGKRELATLVRDCATATLLVPPSRSPRTETPLVGTAEEQAMVTARGPRGSQDVIPSAPRALGLPSSVSPRESGTSLLMFLDPKKLIPPEHAMRLQAVLSHTRPPDMTPQVAQALHALDGVRTSHERTVAAVLRATRETINEVVQRVAGGALKKTFYHHTEESVSGGQSGTGAKTVRSHTDIKENLPEGAAMHITGGRVDASLVSVSVSGPFVAAATMFEDDRPSARAEVTSGGGYAEGAFAAAAGGGLVSIHAEFGAVNAPSASFERQK